MGVLQKASGERGKSDKDEEEEAEDKMRGGGEGGGGTTRVGRVRARPGARACLWSKTRLRVSRGTRAGGGRGKGIHLFLARGRLWHSRGLVRVQLVAVVGL